jgi:hypothetical protein
MGAECKSLKYLVKNSFLIGLFRAFYSEHMGGPEDLVKNLRSGEFGPLKTTLPQVRNL